MPHEDHVQPEIIDLYAGVGGMSLGAIRAGFHLALAVDWDEHAMKAHETNFPGYKHLKTDISELNGESLLEQVGLAEGALDGLVGGPPCQGFSMIGGRNTLDPRNDHFVKFFQLASECRPKFFLVENVLGILTSQYDGIRQRAFGYVNDHYECLEPMKLKASDYGAATSRERVFFAGFRRDIPMTISLEAFEKAKVKKTTTVSDVLQGLPRHIRSGWLTEDDSWKPVKRIQTAYFRKFVDGNIPDGMGDRLAVQRYAQERLVSGCFGTRHTAVVRKRFAKLKPGQSDPISRQVRLKADGLCPTLRAGTGSDKGSYMSVRPVHPTADRVITPREAARLQGFPDWFQFAPSKWHSFRQIGNSVSPILAEAIFRVIYSHLVSSEN